MKQQALPGMESPLNRVINVASVKQRSPFRYPGGKTWLIPYVFKWLGSLTEKPVELIEPFAGGAIVGLTAAFEQLAEHVTLVELDQDVGAVWEAIITHDYGSWLADQIIALELTHENVDKLLEKKDPSLQERAFQTIVRNRINHGGILAAGSGKLKHGENGKGITSRWYPATLRKRILDITAIRTRLSFIGGDGLEVMKQHATRREAVFFIDPPYTASGKKPGSRLYTHWQIDHDKLFRLASELAGSFLMTYDNDPEVQNLADKYRLDTEAIPMKNTHHAKLSELLIGADLDWLRS